MHKLVLTLTLFTALFAQTGCAASDSETQPLPVPDAGAGPAKGYTPLTPDDNEDKIDKEIVRELQHNHYNKIGLND